MSFYPETSPWGPHGPQVPPNTVAPHPSASTTPESSGPGLAPAYTVPAPSQSTFGSGFGGVPLESRRKSYIAGIFLCLLFGPFGILFAYPLKPYVLNVLAMIGAVFAVAFYFYTSSTIFHAAWFFSVPVAMTICLIGVYRHNKNIQGKRI
jgi:hypothetical protein